MPGVRGPEAPACALPRPAPSWLPLELGGVRGRGGARPEHGALPQGRLRGAAGALPAGAAAPRHAGDAGARRQQDPEPAGAGAGPAGGGQRAARGLLGLGPRGGQGRELRRDRQAPRAGPAPAHQAALPADRGQLGARRAGHGPRPPHRAPPRARRVGAAEPGPAGPERVWLPAPGGTAWPGRHPQPQRRTAAPQKKSSRSAALSPPPPPVPRTDCRVFVTSLSDCPPTPRPAAVNPLEVGEIPFDHPVETLVRSAGGGGSPPLGCFRAASGPTSWASGVSCRRGRRNKGSLGVCCASAPPARALGQRERVPPPRAPFNRFTPMDHRLRGWEAQAITRTHIWGLG